MPREVRIITQVWLTGGSPPPEGVASDLPPELVEKNKTPPGWFNEDPKYAAELYALERGIPSGHVGEYAMRISTRDHRGRVARWRVRLIPTVEASVRPEE